MKEEEVDPIVQAALADDGEEDEEEAKLRKEALGLDDEDTTETTDDDDADDAEDDEVEQEDDGEDADDDSEDGDEDSGDEEKQLDKPKEARDDEDEDVPTRKERREARQEDYNDIYKAGRQPQQYQRQNSDYQPLDYNQADEFKPEDLQTDREKYGQVQYLKGAEEVKYWAEQDTFFKELDFENRIIASDPELDFLTPTKPNGKPNPNFDERRASDISELYLNMAGYKEHYKTDQNGNVLIGQDGQPQIYATVDRTDISWEKFARREVDRMKNWSNNEATDMAENKFRNLKKQTKNRSVRPSGQRKRKIGDLSPGKISTMSDEDFDKYEEQIDAQINRALGL